MVRELGEAAVVERRPGGDLVVTVPYANRWALRSWVMGLVDDAEILEPEDLRAEMVALAGGAGRRRGGRRPTVSPAAPPRPGARRRPGSAAC